MSVGSTRYSLLLTCLPVVRLGGSQDMLIFSLVDTLPFNNIVNFFFFFYFRVLPVLVDSDEVKYIFAYVLELLFSQGRNVFQKKL